MNPIAVLPSNPAELSTIERAELGRYEAVIKRGLDTFCAVGNALLAIRREIGRLCHMSKSELEPCMDKLLTIGAIIPVEAGKTIRYIPAVDSLPAKVW